MLRNSLLLSILASLTVGACGSSSDSDTDDADTSVDGQALYRDARTDHAGAAQPAAKPAPQDISVRIDVRGTGTLDGLEPRCNLDQAGGQFSGAYEGEATLDNGGLFASALASAAASFVTPSGCEIPDLTIGVMTQVVIHAEIAATAQNCKAYCEADARADAEAQCGATAAAASCRAQAEAAAQVSCQTSCVSETHRIAADATLSADALAKLNAAALTGTALGELAIDLTFDHVVDAQGKIVGN